MLNQYKIPEVISREQKLQQIKSWVGSETDKSSAEYHSPKRIKFPHNVSLIAACYANDKEEFKRILKLGIDINCRNQDGMACVHQCCINGDYDFLKFLISEGADVNVQDNEGWTPLHAAASIGSEEMVKLLLENNADPSLFSCEMELPVDVAANQEIIDVLNASMQAKGIDPVAARQCEEELLLTHAKRWAETGDYGPHIDPRTGATPLHVAACKDYIRVLELLLAIPGIPLDIQDKDGWTALHAAAHWNREQPARMLAEAGASFDIYTHANQSVFDLADRGFVVILRQLRAKQRTNPKTAPEIKSVATAPAAATAPPTSPPLTSSGPDVQAVAADSSPPRPPEKVTTKPTNEIDQLVSKDSDVESSSSSQEVEDVVVRPDRPGDTADGGDTGARDVAGGAKQAQSTSLTDVLGRSSPRPSRDLRTSVQKAASPAVGDELTGDRRPGVAARKLTRLTFVEQAEPLEIRLPAPASKLSQPSTATTAAAASAVSADAVVGPAKATGRPHVTSMNGDQTDKPPALVEEKVTRNGPSLLPSAVASTGITISTASVSPVDQGKVPSGRPAEDEKTTATSIDIPSDSETDKSYHAKRVLRKRTPPSNYFPELAQGSVATPENDDLDKQDVIRYQTNTSSASSDERPNFQQSSRRASLVSPVTKNDVTETQRSVKARYVRSTRRSTQGVSSEELEEAVRLSGVASPAVAIAAAAAAATAAAAEKNNNAVAPSSRVENHHAAENVIFIGGNPSAGSDRQPVRVSRSAARQPKPSPTLSSVDSSSKVPNQLLTINSRRFIQPTKATGSPSVHRWGATDHQQEGVTSTDDWKTRTSLPTHRPLPSDVNSVAQSTKDSAATLAGAGVKTGEKAGQAAGHLFSVDPAQSGVDSQRWSYQATGDTTSGGAQKSAAASANASNGSVIPRPSSRFLHNSDCPPSQQQQSPASSQAPSSGLLGRAPGTAATASSSLQPTTLVPSASAPRLHPPVTSRYSSGNSLTNSDSDQQSSRWQPDRVLESNLDYRRLYEEEKSQKERLTSELERLKREIARLRVDMSRSSAENAANSRSTSPLSASNSSDNQASIDEEMTRLREENHRIREENGALIRVISKLSQPA